MIEGLVFLAGGENHFVEFVLERESFDLGGLSVVIGGSFDVFLNAVDLFIDLMIFVEESCEVIIADLKLMDGFAALGELVKEVVFFDGHSFVIRVLDDMNHEVVSVFCCANFAFCCACPA
ncbi:hypothetical protein N9Z15_04355 [Akkermansiaceae bacterium]|nr:hypothetical protein [Akkermansiaceae bacterium]